MKILLINTPINRQDILGRFSSIHRDLKMVPTGIAYLASVARSAGIEVRILDEYAECLPMDEVFDLINEFSPNLIGYSVTTPNYYAAVDMVRKIRLRFPDTLTVMGGVHPSIFPRETLNDSAVDFVIRDEGEYTLLALCKALENGKKDFRDIPGLSFKNLAGQVHNKKAESVDLDTLPFPAYDLLPMQLYNSPSYTRFALPVYQMIASRGCPFSCSYCVNAGLDVSARYRRRNLDFVVDEMELLADKYNARQIQFWDPIFPLGEEHALEFCEKLIERSLHKKIVWSSTTRPEFINEKVARMMALSGCRGVGFGVESGVQELLGKVNKSLDLGKVRHACRAARKNGLVVAGSFMLGFPGETREMTQETIDFAKSLDIHYGQFSILVPYPGTPLYRELKESGGIPSREQETDFVRYNQNIGLTDVVPVYIPKGRQVDELKKMQKTAYIQFYLRPRLLWMHLPHLRPWKIVGMTRSLAVVLWLFILDISASFKKAISRLIRR